MFQYEYEKRTPNAAEWGRAATEPPAIVCREIHRRSGMPLRVWAVAGAACLVVCAVFVLATLFVSQWGRGPRYDPRYRTEASTPHINSKYMASAERRTFQNDNSVDDDENSDLEMLEKLAIFKNYIANRDVKKSVDRTADIKTEESLINKLQYYPEHDPTISHSTKRIEKKDQPKDTAVISTADVISTVPVEFTSDIPDFKPSLPDVFGKKTEMKKVDYDYLNEYYEDNFYDEYAQSNSMTSYLIEKIQELHDWINNDSDFEAVANSTKNSTTNEFSNILKALNESIAEGNVSIIMNKLREVYYDEHNKNNSKDRRVILTNDTNLISFGILTLDVMLLHNIQILAWENQESLRIKMLKDPDVFAFNALFMDPSKVEAKRNELFHDHENSGHIKRQNPRHDTENSFAKNIFENILELGMNTARAAINLGRAYKNTRLALNQISNRDKDVTQNIKQLARNADANAHALKILQTFGKNNNGSHGVASNATEFYTELDCVWQLYCRNLVVTTKLNAPYGVMARINGVALRMLSGELPVDKALDTLLYEALTGWTDLKCSNMFSRCSKANAATVVLESIMQPSKRSLGNKTRSVL